ncbi:hypothetical protein T459_29933 [Capsicum annuum]|uniref:Kinesin motor domain-containing protein n=1 Tax=Capsicum annuum TaxID=4072 RepID=A0A2G2Y6Z7_CAPAN|nr:hypothetical protein T459_29933 [Capsicum annuum]
MQDLRSLDQELQESSFKSGNSVSKSKLVHPVHHLRVLMLEGIKEDVVLSPGHVRSFIAAGEQHHHVGSSNFNLFSSRSHIIFTLVSGSGCSLCYISLFDLKFCLSCAHK